MSGHDVIKRLLDGYGEFYRHYLDDNFAEYRNVAAQGQSPRSMIISCSDSRVSPSIITGAALGELFQVRNVANLVPPYQHGKHQHHSTSSALEFAVITLAVEHIIVLGHSGCGGIRALLGDAPLTEEAEYSFIMPWMEIVRPARNRVAHLPEEQKQRACEEEALKISLANLHGFPWIKSRLEKGLINLHAWHFDIASGVLSVYSESEDKFIPAIHGNIR